ncbi:putative sulfate/molybdate transporter [bacterium]|nr:putative sulfate/molybdate transporter [bacterium]
MTNNLKKAIFDARELSGALGDLGTFLPLLVAMVAQNGVDFTAALFFAGFFNVVTGIVFAIPMAVQPMKAIAAVALLQGLSAAQIAAAGLCVSLLVLLISLTGLLDWVQKTLPTSVIRGLQLGLGLSLLIKGVGLIASSGGWWSLDGYPLALVAIFLTFRFESTRWPVALLLFGLGCAVAALQHPVALQPGLHLPHWTPLSWGDLTGSFWSAALPQLPLTLLNSVIAVSALSFDLFPDRPASPRKVAFSVGLMNLVPAFFGGMPMCHGAGGLAGQARFGARSNGSILMLGGIKMFVALLFGTSLLALCKVYPASILGTMLAVSGLELAVVAQRSFTRTEATAMLVTAGVGLALNSPALGLLAGWLMWLCQRRP